MKDFAGMENRAWGKMVTRCGEREHEESTKYECCECGWKGDHTGDMERCPECKSHHVIEKE